MRALLPYFEHELTSLRRRGQAFAQAFPRIAGQLHWGADEAKDPHVERMIEAFALLSARVHKRLDDDFPLFVESLLEVLYPHYLRPFPSCSIAQFELGAAAGQLSRPAVVPRGTLLHARPVKGVACKFRTSHDVHLLPLEVSSASYRNAIAAPEGTRLPAGMTSMLSLSLSLTSPQMTWSALGKRTLRVYLDGEPSQVSVLREALCQKVSAVMIDGGASHPWQMIADGDGQAGLPILAGFGEDEALVEGDARSHAAYRLLTEYFAFPEKFNFVDVPIADLGGNQFDSQFGSLSGHPSSGRDGGASTDGRRTLTLHFLMAGVRSDSDESRMLESVHARNVLLGCVPVVNLFKQPADPIRITHARSAYPVVVDARRAYGYEVHGIDKVFRVRQTPHGENTEEFKPFFSMRHEDLLAMDEGDDDACSASALGAKSAGLEEPGREHATGGRYWSTHRDEDVATESPGYELEISIVDVNFDPALPQTDTLSLMVTATNRELPSLLPFGVPGGDLFIEGGGIAREVRLLRKPTQPMRFERGRGALWRLISHLSLNHLSLSGGGIDALKEMLRLYDLPRSPSNRRQIDGLVSVDFRPDTAWLPGEPYATFVRGTEIRLTVNEDNFVGTGLGLFASVLDRFFALYVHANSFTRLTMVSARTQEEVCSCPPRNGDMQLV